MGKVYQACYDIYDGFYYELLFHIIYGVLSLTAFKLIYNILSYHIYNIFDPNSLPQRDSASPPEVLSKDLWPPNKLISLVNEKQKTSN